MIKGIVALFTSGIIFNPFVLAGIVSGAFAIIKLKPEVIRELFLDYRVYGIVAISAVIYTLIFAKIYQTGGYSIDWTATVWRIIANFAKYFVAFLLAMSFVIMISIF